MWGRVRGRCSTTAPHEPARDTDEKWTRESPLWWDSPANAAQIAQAAGIPAPSSSLHKSYVRATGRSYVVGTNIHADRAPSVVHRAGSTGLAQERCRRTSFPREIAERLSRMEQAVKATAEKWRDREGQRFLTRLFTKEREHAQSVPAPRSRPRETGKVFRALALALLGGPLVAKRDLGFVLDEPAVEFWAPDSSSSSR